MPKLPLLLCAIACHLNSAADAVGQTTQRHSLDSAGNEANDDSYEPAISLDGNLIVFHSDADNLVPSDTNGWQDVFLHNRLTGETQRVSEDANGVGGDYESGAGCISGDGRYVAFQSYAENLVPGDGNGLGEIFILDLQSGLLERPIRGMSGVEANGFSDHPSLSHDGRFLCFMSDASNLVPNDTNFSADVFVLDRTTGSIERVSIDSNGNEGNGGAANPMISGFGNAVAFQSYSSNLVANDTNGRQDIFVHDRQSGITERVSVHSNGSQGSSDSSHCSISENGDRIAFLSDASNLVDNDTNFSADVFVHFRMVATTLRVNVSSNGEEALGASMLPSISPDGNFVTFVCLADNLVARPTSAFGEVYVHDLPSATTEVVSVTSKGQTSTHGGRNPVLSWRGQIVVFDSLSYDLVFGDNNKDNDIFSHDRWDGLGANSIYLTGPSSSAVGSPITLSWSEARSSSDYWLIYSRNLRGAVIGGHEIDLGFNLVPIAAGNHTRSGEGSAFEPSVPSHLAGLTLYFEVVARDGNGVLYDSNALAVTFY